MMMCLGQFVFSLPTLAYTELQRQTAWRHPTAERVGARAASQYLGVGDDTISLQGVVLPGFGDRVSLAELHEMADTGAAWPLVDGTGRVWGQWVITDKSEGASLFTAWGEPLRVEFTLTMRRVDDDRVDRAEAQA